ncbi:MAG: aminopeptidase P family protein [Gemmatimonadales bacterium]|nr:MAG: aminopeptidase P family protein [Gemmatimonadales bacterium]
MIRRRLFLPVLALLLTAAPSLSGQATLSSISLDEFAERRGGLAEVVGEGWILAVGGMTAPQPFIPFHQDPVFRYLTGFTQPEAALLIRAEGGEVRDEILFVQPRDPAAETWDGYRMGPEASAERTGIPGRSVQDLAVVVDSLAAAGALTRLHVAGAYNPDAAVANDVTQRIRGLLARHQGVEVEVVTPAVDRMRQVKSEAEVALLRRSIEITSEAHREVARALRPGMNEFEIQALIEYTFRRYGAERPAFSSIVGSGPNSTILHYETNDDFMEDGEVLLVDVGAAFGGYAADITRTYPVNGRFSDAQREIYQLVLDAQQAAEAVAGPGVSMGQLSQAATVVLAEGLAELGLIEAPDAVYEDEMGRQVPQLRLFYMHGLGHGIGLHVHDPTPPVLEPGVVFTIEPGIYVRENLFTDVIPDTPRNRAMMEAIGPAFQRYVNIGVRIEDNYLVTAQGLERLSDAPREVDEVEALMASGEPTPGARRDQWVERFREMR